MFKLIMKDRGTKTFSSFQELNILYLLKKMNKKEKEFRIPEVTCAKLGGNWPSGSGEDF